VVTDVLEEYVISFFRMQQSKMNFEDRSSTPLKLPVLMA